MCAVFIHIIFVYIHIYKYIMSVIFRYLDSYEFVNKKGLNKTFFFLDGRVSTQAPLWLHWCSGEHGAFPAATWPLVSRQHFEGVPALLLDLPGMFEPLDLPLFASQSPIFSRIPRRRFYSTYQTCCWSKRPCVCLTTRLVSIHHSRMYDVGRSVLTFKRSWSRKTCICLAAMKNKSNSFGLFWLLF